MCVPDDVTILKGKSLRVENRFAVWTTRRVVPLFLRFIALRSPRARLAHHGIFPGQLFQLGIDRGVEFVPCRSAAAVAGFIRPGIRRALQRNSGPIGFGGDRAVHVGYLSLECGCQESDVVLT